MPILSKECAQKKPEIDDLKNFFLFFCHKLDVRYATKSRKKFFSGDIFARKMAGWIKGKI